MTVSCAGYQLEPSVWTSYSEGESNAAFSHADNDAWQAGIQFTLAPPTKVHHDDMHQLAEILKWPVLQEPVPGEPVDPDHEHPEPEDDEWHEILLRFDWPQISLLSLALVGVIILGALGKIHIPFLGKNGKKEGDADEGSHSPQDRRKGRGDKD